MATDKKEPPEYLAAVYLLRMSHVDDRALELTERNAAALGLRNVMVHTPRQVPADQTFAGIYSISNA